MQPRVPFSCIFIFLWLIGLQRNSRFKIIISSEIKTWLNINHITVHNNTYFILLKLKEQLLKIQKLHNKQTSNLHTRTHTHTHTHTHTALMFEQIYLFRNAAKSSVFVYFHISTADWFATKFKIQNNFISSEKLKRG